MAFPKPDRSTFVPNFMVTEENTVVDIGFGEGELSDGRPFRIEYWAEDGICTITYIMSIEGLEGESKESLADMLVSEGLLVFLDHENRYLGVTEMTDASGNRMLWMHTVIGDDEGVYAEGKYPLYPYPGAPWA